MMRTMGYYNLVSSWNHAIEYAKGDFFVKASDDVFYASDIFEKMCLLYMKTK